MPRAEKMNKPATVSVDNIELAAKQNVIYYIIHKHKIYFKHHLIVISAMTMRHETKGGMYAPHIVTREQR